MAGEAEEKASGVGMTGDRASSRASVIRASPTFAPFTETATACGGEAQPETVRRSMIST
ncbi:MAG TPA: hypothetical protein VEK82_11365 [Stellaceae bacterium]|nr:hypothetical protein [Stellaceae bacterium]